MKLYVPIEKCDECRKPAQRFVWLGEGPNSVAVCEACLWDALKLLESQGPVALPNVPYRPEPSTLLPPTLDPPAPEKVKRKRVKPTNKATAELKKIKANMEQHLQDWFPTRDIAFLLDTTIGVVSWWGYGHHVDTQLIEGRRHHNLQQCLDRKAKGKRLIKQAVL